MGTFPAPHPPGPPSTPTGGQNQGPGVLSNTILQERGAERVTNRTSFRIPQTNRALASGSILGPNFHEGPFFLFVLKETSFQLPGQHLTGDRP